MPKITGIHHLALICGEGMKVCFLTDPEGNRVELIQGYRDQDAV